MKKLVLLFALVCTISFTGKKEILWVAIGDSITYLNDHPDETNDRVSKGYMTRVKEKLPHIRFINQGHNGWTSGRIAESLEKLDFCKADVYTVFLGTNDWWQGRPAGTLADYKNNTGNETVNGSFRLIMDELRGLNKKARIILITPMQRGDFIHYRNMKNNAYGSYRDKNGQSLERIVLALDSIGRYEKVQVVDLYHAPDLPLKDMVKFKYLKDPQTGEYKKYAYPDYIDIPFNAETDEYPYPVEAINLTYDGLHPSDKGNEIIAGKLVKIMEKY
jgi:lysophospholipase L1-like esterase